MADADNDTTGSSVLASLTHEVEEFVASGGWDQPVQLFALVPTERLLEQQPELRDQVDAAAPLTPVAQESLPEGDLDEALAAIEWPETVRGCALAQEIVVLPPDAEANLPDGADPSDTERLRQAAADHPLRTEARLVAAVTRDAQSACVMRLRGRVTQEGEPNDEIIERPDLAPNLVRALERTLQ